MYIYEFKEWELELFYRVYESQSEISWEACILFNNKTPVAETAFNARLAFFFPCWKKCQVNYNQN